MCNTCAGWLCSCSCCWLYCAPPRRVDGHIHDFRVWCVACWQHQPWRLAISWLDRGHLPLRSFNPKLQPIAGGGGWTSVCVFEQKTPTVQSVVPVVINNTAILNNQNSVAVKQHDTTVKNKIQNPLSSVVVLDVMRVSLSFQTGRTGDFNTVTGKKALVSPPHPQDCRTLRSFTTSRDEISVFSVETLRHWRFYAFCSVF